MAINVLPSDTLLECLKERVADLGEKSVNLFRNAVNRSKSDLLESYILPNLLSPGNSYIYIAEDKGGKGSRRAFDPGNTVVASMATLGEQSGFSRSLGAVHKSTGVDRHRRARPPSERPRHQSRFHLLYARIRRDAVVRAVESHLGRGIAAYRRDPAMLQRLPGALRWFMAVAKASIFISSLISVIGTTISPLRIIARTRITG